MSIKSRGSSKRKSSDLVPLVNIQKEEDGDVSTGEEFTKLITVFRW